jgi:hypothetical protein
MPASGARDTGADIVIAVLVDNPLTILPAKEFRSLSGILGRMTDVMLAVADARQLPFADIVINPDVSGIGVVNGTRDDAKKAILGHLKQDSATHARVAAAILPNGEMYKLDGHTRSYLWSIGKLTPPKAVLVDVYHVETIADVIETYKHFDNSSAAENATDRLRGALKLHGINAKSGVILYAGLTTALSFIYVKKSKCFDVIEPIGNFKKEIMLIDSLGLTYKQMTAGVLAAMILSVRIYGEQALPFFCCVS